VIFISPRFKCLQNLKHLPLLSLEMKASDSTSSLAELTGGDPACFFCAEPPDPELGGALVLSKNFSSCQCKYSVHSQCWNEYLQSTKPGERPVCPSCKKDVLPLRILEVYAENPKKTGRHTPLLLVISFVAAVAIIGLIMWATLKK
jgi:hypothetical protein